MQTHASVHRLLFLPAALALSLAPVFSPASENEASAGQDPVSLAGRHAFAVSVGTLALTTGPGVVRSQTSTDVLGEISYSHWLAEDWSIGLSAGALVFGAETGLTAGASLPAMASDVPATARFRSATITSVLLNIGYHPARVSIGGWARPYLSLSVGPYLASGENVRVGTDAAVESVTDTAFGARVLAGVDVYLGRHLQVGLSGGYRFVGDFEEPIRDYRDYSGPEFALEFGILLGGGG